MRFQPSDQAIQEALDKGLPLLTAKSSVVAMGNPLLLASFCFTSIIRPGLIAGFTTEAEAKDACEEHQPDFLFVADDLQQGYATTLIKSVTECSPKTKALLFTDRESVSVVRDTINSGAAGVVFFSSIGRGMDGDFAPALVAMASGGVYYPPEIRAAANYEIKPLPDLSAREHDVLKELCLGHSNKAIAERLMLSTETIKGYVSSVIAKLGAEDRLSAVVTAIRMGF